VDPVDVERCLAGHPEVAEVVVVGVRARSGDLIVKAFVLPKSPRAPAREDWLRRELVSRCREQLADFKVPRQIEFRDEIPRSPLGKVLRKYLV
jgi:long-chain acyl-CoA synthetase